MSKTAIANTIGAIVSLALFVSVLVLAALFSAQNMSAYISNVEQESAALQEGQWNIVNF